MLDHYRLKRAMDQVEEHLGMKEKQSEEHTSKSEELTEAEIPEQLKEELTWPKEET